MAKKWYFPTWGAGGSFTLAQVNCRGDANRVHRRAGSEILMPQKMVAVNYNKCRPEQCDSGICAATVACPHKLLKQEVPYVIPMPSPSICKDCAKCVLACPLRAIELM